MLLISAIGSYRPKRNLKAVLHRNSSYIYLILIYIDILPKMLRGMHTLTSSSAVKEKHHAVFDFLKRLLLRFHYATYLSAIYLMSEQVRQPDCFKHLSEHFVLLLYVKVTIYVL